MKVLIVNADDFGLSHGVNRGIARGHDEGIVTSASLMARWPAAAEAAAMARERSTLSVGLHLDIAEWAYRGGEWVRLYEVVREDDEAGLRDEVERQIALFRSLVGTDPTHIDSHQHVHRKEPLRSLVAEQGERMGVPVRHLSPSIRYYGGFYGQSDEGDSYPELVSVEALVRTIASLPEGVTELGCHPGYAEEIDSMYREERALEIEALCNPRVRAALHENGIELRSFANLHTSPPRMMP